MTIPKSPGRPRLPRTPSRNKNLKSAKDKNRPSKKAYLYALRKINQHIYKVRGGAMGTNITATAAHESFQKYNGCCAFCGLELNVRRTEAFNGLNFLFYTPLEVGGEQSLENMIPVCRDHAKVYSYRKEFLEEIPDLNCFADILEVLIDSIIKAKKFEEKKSSDFFPMSEKVKRLKRLLNFRLGEIAAAMRYKTFRDWYPENYEIIRQDHNTISDLVEIATESAIEEDKETLGKAKEKITKQIKQIAVSKQYRIVRK